jgi:hypothetical protein
VPVEDLKSSTASNRLFNLIFLIALTNLATGRSGTVNLADLRVADSSDLKVGKDTPGEGLADEETRIWKKWLNRRCQKQELFFERHTQIFSRLWGAIHQGGQLACVVIAGARTGTAAMSKTNDVRVFFF